MPVILWNIVPVFIPISEDYNELIKSIDWTDETMNRIGFRKTIIIGFTVIMFVSAIVFCILMGMLNSTRKDFLEIVNERSEPLHIRQEIQQNYQYIDAILSQVAIENVHGVNDEMIKSISDRQMEIEQGYEKLDDLTGSVEGRAFLIELRSLLDVYFQNGYGMIEDFSEDESN